MAIMWKEIAEAVLDLSHDIPSVASRIFRYLLSEVSVLTWEFRPIEVIFGSMLLVVLGKIVYNFVKIL